MRTLPYVGDWYKKYANHGLVVVGVHSPEFEFEKEEANVREAQHRLEVIWPVAMDNDFHDLARLQEPLLPPQVPD